MSYEPTPSHSVVICYKYNTHIRDPHGLLCVRGLFLHPLLLHPRRSCQARNWANCTLKRGGGSLEEKDHNGKLEIQAQETGRPHRKLPHRFYQTALSYRALRRTSSGGLLRALAEQVQHQSTELLISVVAHLPNVSEEFETPCRIVECGGGRLNRGRSAPVMHG